MTIVSLKRASFSAFPALLALVLTVPLISGAGKPVPATPVPVETHMASIPQSTVDRVVQNLVAQWGSTDQERIRRGVTQVSLLWRASDGSEADFASFCEKEYLGDPKLRSATMDRFEANGEVTSGAAVALVRKYREPVDLDLSEPLPLDELYAAFNPFDHYLEDTFRTRIAFVGLLNFRLYKLSELVGLGPKLDRNAWAEARLAGSFELRISGEARAAETAAVARGDDYVSSYNIYLGNVLSSGGQRLFPEDLKLISHWGLRDEIKSLYADPVGNLEKQRLILQVMEKIVRQEIPASVVNEAGVLWEPATGKVSAKGQGSAPKADREPDVRYARILEIFRAERQVDVEAPLFPTYMDRKFDIEREIPKDTVSALLVDVLQAPAARGVAALIRRRLGRPLEPFDVWYDGFKARGAFKPEDLDRAVAARYPTVAAFQADVPAILGKLGFSPATATFLAQHIVVDPARGAGHAMGAGARYDSAHLRTRVGPKGMDYKGYNIALHELGHNVEQVFTLNKVDRTLLSGVPNNAFTEAFAFLFQARDLEVLGLETNDPKAKKEAVALRALDDYWSAFEIAGVALLDIATWEWLYAHPEATPAELREAVVQKAIEIWNRYYAPVLGVKDTPLLAIYSHMVAYPLYLPDYPIGHLIDFQIEQYIQGRSLATEMERMCVQGKITPDAWMRGAVGAPLSAAPINAAAADALKTVRR
jgi:hypothetical protein